MFIIRWILIILSLTLAFGCTTIMVRPIDKSIKMKHTCIKEIPKSAMLSII